MFMGSKRYINLAEVEASIISPTGDVSDKKMLYDGQEVLVLGRPDGYKFYHWIVLVNGVLMIIPRYQRTTEFPFGIETLRYYPIVIDKSDETPVIVEGQEYPKWIVITAQQLVKKEGVSFKVALSSLHRFEEAKRIATISKVGSAGGSLFGNIVVFLVKFLKKRNK